MLCIMIVHVAYKCIIAAALFMCNALTFDKSTLHKRLKMQFRGWPTSWSIFTGHPCSKNFKLVSQGCLSAHVGFSLNSNKMSLLRYTAINALKLGGKFIRHSFDCKKLKSWSKLNCWLLERP